MNVVRHDDIGPNVERALSPGPVQLREEHFAGATIKEQVLPSVGREGQFVGMAGSVVVPAF